MGADIIFLIAVLIISVVFHEVAHGVAAHYLGDPTAKLAGRLTLNPVPHIDPIGSVVLPAILALSSSPFLLGWAKPVPYNPYNLRRGGRFAEAFVAVAGPATNVVIALIFGLLVRFGAFSNEVVGLAISIVFLNILLAIFNLIPIPPLDGSKVLGPLLPRGLSAQYERLRTALEHNMLMAFGAVVLFILLFGGQFAAFISSITRLITGA